jgi:hypothetical protein
MVKRQTIFKTKENIMEPLKKIKDLLIHQK